jgi:hypothetical protein
MNDLSAQMQGPGLSADTDGPGNDAYRRMVAMHAKIQMDESRHTTGGR